MLSKVMLVALAGHLLSDYAMSSPICALRLCLRGGSTMLKQPSLKTSSSVIQMHPDEFKPELQRSQSILVLNEVDVPFKKLLQHITRISSQTILSNRSSTKPAMIYKVDGKEVTEAEYNQRVQKVVDRALDPWIAQSDMGGLREGDVLVPDHFKTIPEAIAAVKHGGTVYIRSGKYKWDGVLVVQKHMHVRGEPNPDEGIPGGQGRPTLEGRWLLGEKSSGSFKHVNCIARFDNKA